MESVIHFHGSLQFAKTWPVKVTSSIALNIMTELLFILMMKVESMYSSRMLI